MNNCFVDDINKLCFVNIPKNASTTIRKNLHLKNCKYTEKYKDYHKIVVIRNPMTRIISSYNEVIKLRKDGPYKHTVRTQFYHYYKVRHDIEKSFDLFLDYIKNNMYDNHVMPQYTFIESKGLTINDFEHIILFENLEEELKKIIKLYDLNYNKINHLQSGNNGNKKKIRNFIQKYAKKIRSVYSKDFELYKDIITNK